MSGMTRDEFEESCRLLGIFSAEDDSPTRVADIAWHAADWCDLMGRRFSLEDALRMSADLHGFIDCIGWDPFDPTGDRRLYVVAEDVARMAFPEAMPGQARALTRLASLRELGSRRLPEAVWCERHRDERRELWKVARGYRDLLPESMSMASRDPLGHAPVPDATVRPTPDELELGRARRFAVNRFVYLPDCNASRPGWHESFEGRMYGARHLAGWSSLPIGLYPTRELAEEAFARECEVARLGLEALESRLPAGARALAALCSSEVKIQEQEWATGRNLGLFGAETLRVRPGQWEIARVPVDDVEDGESLNMPADLTIRRFECSVLEEKCGAPDEDLAGIYDYEIREHFGGIEDEQPWHQEER